MSEERQYYSSCKLTKAVDQFRVKTNGTCNSTCLSCNLRTSSANRERRLKKKENLDPAGNAEEEDASRADLAPLPLKDFLDALKEQEEQIELEARINIASISGSQCGKRVLALNLKDLLLPSTLNTAWQGRIRWPSLWGQDHVFRNFLLGQLDRLLLAWDYTITRRRYVCVNASAPIRSASTPISIPHLSFEGSILKINVSHSERELGAWAWGERCARFAIETRLSRWPVRTKLLGIKEMSEGDHQISTTRTCGVATGELSVADAAERTVHDAATASGLGLTGTAPLGLEGRKASAKVGRHCADGEKAVAMRMPCTQADVHTRWGAVLQAAPLRDRMVRLSHPNVRGASDLASFEGWMMLVEAVLGILKQRGAKVEQEGCTVQEGGVQRQNAREAERRRTADGHSCPAPWEFAVSHAEVETILGGPK
ncbi:hypothetical protein C8R45DRAFT_933136 [Mycena sanguinolenta]|nr:hypothetical protein C8R45DRAFT_933136 [Mycena sanguinolenta]